MDHRELSNFVMKISYWEELLKNKNVERIIYKQTRIMGFVMIQTLG